MVDEVNLDDALAQMQKIMHEYNDLAREIKNHHTIQKAHHHLHELQLNLGHLKAMVEEGGVEDEERKKHFLERHCESVRHILNHMFHVREHMELHRFEAGEQQELLKELHNTYQKLHELYEKICQRKEMEEYYKHHTHVSPYANPFPVVSHRDD